MPDHSTTFTYTDPRSINGTPYEAANGAIVQTRKVIRLLLVSLQDAESLALNAFMQRNLDQGEEPQAEAWDDDAQAKSFRKLQASLVDIDKKLKAIGIAVKFDPKHIEEE